MRVVCSYCRETYATKPGEGVSHGQCKHCHKIAMDDMNRGGNCNVDDIRAKADLRLPACQRAGGM